MLFRLSYQRHWTRLTQNQHPPASLFHPQSWKTSPLWIVGSENRTVFWTQQNTCELGVIFDHGDFLNCHHSDSVQFVTMVTLNGFRLQKNSCAGSYDLKIPVELSLIIALAERKWINRDNNWNGLEARIFSWSKRVFNLILYIFSYLFTADIWLFCLFTHLIHERWTGKANNGAQNRPLSCLNDQNVTQFSDHQGIAVNFIVNIVKYNFGKWSLLLFNVLSISAVAFTLTQ